MRFPHRRFANAIAASTKVIFGLAPINLRSWGRWISFIVVELWLRMVRGREIRRMRKAWATIDDRTLRDLGVSRWEMAHAGVEPAPAADMKVTPTCHRINGPGFSGCRAEIASRIFLNAPSPERSF